jgi:TusA-related sulfurtransferase
MRVVDARGQACPQPVILTRNALSEASQVVVIVDNQTARTNVARTVERAGCQGKAEQQDGGTCVLIKRGVRLVTEGSESLDDFALCKKGVEVLSCSTCLRYYGLTDKVETVQVSNMYNIAETLLRADSAVSIQGSS